jgi:hypothetical protein
MAADKDRLRLVVASLPKPGAAALPKNYKPGPPPAAGADNCKEDYTNYSEEWVKAREATDKFDGNLFDLRKYGFSLITGLITAGSFLGFSTPTQLIQVGVIIVTMGLIIILYWLDIYHQSLLYGAVFRTRFLEIFRLNRGLSIYISALYGASHLGRGLHFIYIGFLIALFLLGLFVVNVATVTSDSSKNENANTFQSNTNGTSTLTKASLRLILYISFILAFIGMVLIYLLSDLRRTRGVKRISSLFKYYYDDREDKDKVREVEEQLNILFDRYHWL